jgi:hypothetical protein
MVTRAAIGYAAIAFIAVGPGCLKPVEPKPSSIDLGGTWNYTGSQTGPVRETLSGPLNISSESGSTFQGRLDLVAVNTQTGMARTLGGLVSGAQSKSNLIDFDANLEAAPRRHVGQIVADTMSGTWVGSASDGSIISGTFRAER